MKSILQSIRPPQSWCYVEELWMIKKEYIFPIVLIALDIGAGMFYGAAGEYKKLVCWLAAAVLNIAVAF